MSYVVMTILGSCGIGNANECRLVGTSFLVVLGVVLSRILVFLLFLLLCDGVAHPRGSTSYQSGCLPLVFNAFGIGSCWPSKCTYPPKGRSIQELVMSYELF